MAKAHKITGVKPLRSYRENARIILLQRVEEVYRWEPFIRDAARRAELHNMRISIKHLRYTMELFRMAYRYPKKHSKKLATTDDKRFAEFLAVIVDLQEILGDIHDCDVVLEVLTDYGTQSGHETVASGVAKLIAQTKKDPKRGLQNIFGKMGILICNRFQTEIIVIFGIIINSI